jgi:hypothetical protein
VLLKITQTCRRASASRAAARSTKTQHNRAIVLTCSPRDRVAIAELCDCSGPLTGRFPSDRRGHGPSAFAPLHSAITAFARPANNCSAAAWPLAARQVSGGTQHIRAPTSLRRLSPH